MDYKDELKEVKEELNIPNEVKNTEGNLDEENEIKLSSGEVLRFDFDKITGNAVIKIKDKYAKDRKRRASMIAEFDDVYYMMFAEYLTGKPLAQLMNLKYKDFMKVKNFVNEFLIED